MSSTGLEPLSPFRSPPWRGPLSVPRSLFLVLRCGGGRSPFRVPRPSILRRRDCRSPFHVPCPSFSAVEMAALRSAFPVPRPSAVEISALRSTFPVPRSSLWRRPLAVPRSPSLFLRSRDCRSPIRVPVPHSPQQRLPYRRSTIPRGCHELCHATPPSRRRSVL